MQQADHGFDIPKEGVSVTELKRVIEMLPLETSAVNAVAPRLAMLGPKQFAALLTELARDNHAFRYACMARSLQLEAHTSMTSSEKFPHGRSSSMLSTSVVCEELFPGLMPAFVPFLWLALP